MKRILLIVALCAVAYAQLLEERLAVLPKFDLKSQMSEEVKKFVEENSGETQRNYKTINVKRDVLGRRTLDSVLYKVDLSKEAKMKVLVSFAWIPATDLEPLTGRYESGAYHGLGKRYWLNGVEMDESKYLQKYEYERIKRKSKSSAYRAPYVASLTADEIKNLMNGPEIVYVSEYMQQKPASNDTTVGGRVYYKDSVIRVQSQIQTHAFVNGYKGNGIGIYFNETGCPNLNYVNQSLYTQGNTCDHGTRTHPTGVVRVLQTTAPQAMVYGFDELSWPTDPLDYTPPIYIGSHSWHVSTDSVYLQVDELMDDYIFSTGVIEFICAGNRNSSGETHYVSSPGKAVNAITVGAIEPDTYKYATYTRWKNSAVKNQKPEVPNFSHFYFEGDAPFSIMENGLWKTYNGTFDGTSASTPYTAAMAADVLSQHPFFKTHPEMFKALMMTGSTVQITGASTRDRDNYSRVKRIPQYSNMGWNTRSAYWNGANSSFFSADSTISFVETGIVSGAHYRIAISWLSSGGYVKTNKKLPQDMDLFIYQNGQLVDSSESPDNPFELVDFTTSSSNDLTIVIKRKRNAGGDQIALGYNLAKIN